MSARLPVVPGGASRPVKIVTLGRFGIFLGGKPLRFGRKTPARPLALLKYLAAHGGEVSDVQVAGTLWPGKGLAALRSLAVNVHRLRHLLAQNGTLVYRERRVAIDGQLVWCDAFVFERLIDHAESAARDEERIRFCRRALALYRGDFLRGEALEPWMLPVRERLRARFVNASAMLGRSLAAAGRWQEARACFQRGLEMDTRAEELRLGLRTANQALYRQLLSEPT